MFTNMWPLILSILSIFTTVSGFTQPFSTKTSYSALGPRDTKRLLPPGCQPAMFWLLARHGTRSTNFYIFLLLVRNPGDKDLAAMSSQLPGLRDGLLQAWQEGQGQMEEGQVDRLRGWGWNLTMEDASQLTRWCRRRRKGRNIVLLEGWRR